jgi:hypothetical protein
MIARIDNSAFSNAVEQISLAAAPTVAVLEARAPAQLALATSK